MLFIHNLERQSMLVNLPLKRLLRIVTTYQRLGKSPNAACRDVLRHFENSHYYKKLEVEAFIDSDLQDINPVLKYLKNK